MNRRDMLKIIPLSAAGYASLPGLNSLVAGSSVPYAEVKQYNGTPTFFLDGRPVFYSGMWVTTPSPEHWGHAEESWPHPHGGNSDTAQRTAETGIHIYAFGAGHEWCGPRKGLAGHFDFSNVEASFNRIIVADPQARFHLRINLEKGEW